MCNVNIYNWNFHTSSYIYQLYYYGKKGYMIYLPEYNPKIKKEFELNTQLDKLFYLDECIFLKLYLVKDDDPRKKEYLGDEDMCLSDSLLFNHNLPHGVSVTPSTVLHYLDVLYKYQPFSDGYDNSYDVINEKNICICLDGIIGHANPVESDPQILFSKRRLSSQVFN